MRAFPRPISLALALAVLPGLGHALGLGALRGEAFLGEPLRVEVQLIGDSPAPLGRECVALQRPEQTPDDGSFPRNMTARLESRANGQVIVLTTPTSVAMPILEFRISLRCGFNVSREYSLLPLPRNEVTKPATEPEPTAAKPAPPPATAKVAKAPRAARIPDGVDAVIYSVGKDMTVAELAEEYFRNQPMRRARFKRWVLEANPGLSADSKLSKGQDVTIPSGIPPRRPGDRQDPVTGEFLNADETTTKAPATPVAPAAANRPEKAATAAIAKDDGGTRAPIKDQLKIGGENKPPSFRNMKEAGQIIDRLNTLLEQQLAATVSAEDKLGKLETSVNDLQQRLGKAEANMAAADTRNKAALQAAQDALTAQEERSQWLITVAGLGGLVAGAAITLALVVLLRRKPKQPPQFFAPGNAADDAPDTVLADLSAPTEAPPATAPAAEPEPSNADLGKSAFHRETIPEAAPATIKTLRPSLDFREALAQSDRAAEASTHQAAAVADTPPAPPLDLDFELEPETRLELDPLDFTPEPTSATPLPPLSSVFESLNVTLPASPEPAAALTAGETGAGIVELTNVMVSMGLANSAAETLARHIAENPRQSLQHWLKLLEVYRLQGSRDAFEKTAEELRTHFNVQAGSWEGQPGHGADTGLPTRTSLEDFPHLLRNIQTTWREAGCVQYLHSLLTDNRQGTRSGFSQSVAEELLLLIAMLSEQG